MNTDADDLARRKAFWAAWIRARSKMRPIARGGMNTYHGSRYPTLEAVIDAVIEVAASEGLAVMMGEVIIGETPMMETLVAHVEGHSERSYVRIADIPGPNQAQAYGSGSAYARRYGLMTAFVLAAEDDDGEGVRRRDSDQPSPQPPSQPPPRSGKALYAWAMSMDRQHGRDLVASMSKHGQSLGWSDRITEWSEDQVARGYQWACRVLGTES